MFFFYVSGPIVDHTKTQNNINAVKGRYKNCLQMYCFWHNNSSYRNTVRVQLSLSIPRNTSMELDIVQFSDLKLFYKSQKKRIQNFFMGGISILFLC